MFTRSQKKSIRRAVRESRLGDCAIQAILKDLGWKPHNPHGVQFWMFVNKRMEFYEHILQWIDDCSGVLYNIISFYETGFHVAGFVNRYNCHY